MANFFIRRPIVAIVISILIVLLGLFALRGLSLRAVPVPRAADHPRDRHLPGRLGAWRSSSRWPRPIEQEVNGVEGMIYMKSSNTSDGRMQLDVNFQVGIDQDMANVLTQNRVSSAQARLPQEVVQQGVTVKKQSPSILMLISLYSPKGTLRRELPHQLLRHQPARPAPAHPGHRPGGPLRRHRLRHAHLARAGHAGQARPHARPTSSRPSRSRTSQAPAGRSRRRARRRQDQEFTYTVSAPGRLVTPEEFENIIIRETATGAQIRIKDVGRAELGSQDYNSFGRLERQAGRRDGRLPACPARTSSRRPRRSTRRWSAAKALFPPDMDYKIVYDTTPAVEASIESIVHTFVEAVILVTLVVFIFLQNFRATIIPLLTVPVSLHRHLHLLPAARLLGQHAVDVRPRAGDRHRGGRRDRRRRGGDAPHRARDDAARRDASRR